MTPIPTEWWLRPVSKRSPRRGAQRRRVEAVVLQAVPGQPLSRRRRARPAERARRGEADVVEQDDKHVRRARRWPQRLDREGTTRPGPWRRMGAFLRTACPGSAGRRVKSDRSLSAPLRATRAPRPVGRLGRAIPARLGSGGALSISRATEPAAAVALRSVADSPSRGDGRGDHRGLRDRRGAW